MIVMLKAQKVVLSLFQRKDLIEKSKCIEYIENFTDEQYVIPTVDMQFKHSQYNIAKNKGRTYILYNTLFNSMITLSNTEYEQYEKISFFELDIVEILVNNGFLIPANIDEFARYCYYKDVLINENGDSNHYTLALTSKCNARCFYCYEEGIPKHDMSIETADRFTEILLNSNKNIDISWFGGEPLLRTDIISHITDKLNKNNKSFASNIITNGSLLSKEIIQNRFPKWNIQWIQITIDGMREEYLKRKRYYSNKESIFDTILENIDLLVQQNIDVSIRLNIDKNNIEESIKVANYFNEKYPKNQHIYVYPAFLYSSDDCIFEECDRTSCSSNIYSLSNPNFNTLTYYPKVNSCFINQQGAFVIDTDGSILACDGDVGKQKTKFSDVFAIDNFDDLEKPSSVIPKVREMCSSCVYYPKCGGGCANTYGNSCKYDACFMVRYETEFLINQLINA